MWSFVISLTYLIFQVGRSLLTPSSCQKGCPGIVIKILPSQITDIENDYHLFGRRYLLYAVAFKKSILRVPIGASGIIPKEALSWQNITKYISLIMITIVNSIC